MSDTIITVQNLSKKYLLSHLADNREQLLSRLLVNKVNDMGARIASSLKTGSLCRDPADKQTTEEFWALNDISFEIKQGDRVGIIGRNGAGKSTLLKILSRITEPTRGRITVDGRMASLLEVGTGFHSELSGRENIYLNGAILGMSREEIKRKFDEIVAFSEVEKFLDTPVKRYSSGMYVRLAFAVAAHLEPEILIVDEVLAVGDAAFQKKCLGKMKDAGKEGRTVLFVSHNMSAIRDLCTRGIVLKNGAVTLDGLAGEAADAYLREAIGDGDTCSGELVFAADPKKEFQVLSIRLKNPKREITTSFDCDESIIVEMCCVSRQPTPGLYGYLGVMNREGQTVFVSDSLDVSPNRLDGLPSGEYEMHIEIPARSLAHGEYVLCFSFTSSQASSGFYVDRPGETVAFTLTDSSTLRGNRREGYFSTLLKWDLDATNRGAVI